MDLAYLTGQRPADTLRMLKPHIQSGFSEVKQGKPKKKLRIILEGTDKRSELGELLDRSSPVTCNVAPSTLTFAATS
jgi:hypothetical protein